MPETTISLVLSTCSRRSAAPSGILLRVSDRESCDVWAEPPYPDRASNLEIVMSTAGPVRHTLSFKKTSHAVIYQKLDALLGEWRDWLAELEEIPYPRTNPYSPVPFQSLFKDSPENLKRHRILQEKTIVFLDNNIEGSSVVSAGERHAGGSGAAIPPWLFCRTYGAIAVPRASTTAAAGPWPRARPCRLPFAGRSR